jgi:hypothetical protein
VSFGSERSSLAVLDLVKDYVVFEGIRANDVVVVLIAKPPDNSGGAISLALNGFKPYLHLGVFQEGSFVDGEREPARSAVRGNLGEHVRRTRGRVVS